MASTIHSRILACLLRSLGCIGTAAALAVLPAAAQSSSVVINEVHYDQASGEQEFIELLVVSGPVNLSGWTIADQDELTYTLGGSGKPCNGNLTLNTGDRLTLWQGNGSSVCTGSTRKVYLNVPTFLQKDGDDVVLRNSSSQCRDYVAFESGPSVNATPSGCSWSGTNRSNGNVAGTSLSRFDGPPFSDTHNASDWERSGATTTTGPKTPGAQNETFPDADGDGVPDATDNCPVNSNSGQTNADGDSFGDACDDCPNDTANDADGDGVCGNVDNCPFTANGDQADSNGNGAGDACELSSVSPVYINEVHYDQAANEQEFIELYAVTGPVDLAGWKLSDQDQATFTFGAPGTPCAGALTLSAGERLVVWQGSGTSDCTAPDRKIYLNRGTFLQKDGDDLVLRSADNACRDYVAFENGPSVDPRPADCPWSGPNPSNGNATGVSLSRFDSPPFTDTNSGADWEKSGTTTTIPPATPGSPNESVDVDADGDGYTVADGDCDDGDPARSPGASETCNGIDDDCDGTSDDGFPDADGDGFGNVCDNCPNAANPSQTDSDSNGVGDACQPGAVVISEVNYDQAVGHQEFIELLVVGVAADLSGWKVLDQDEMTYTLGLPGSPCFGSFSLNPGDRLVLWQGAGVSVCTGPVRHVYMNRGTFLQRQGDDVVLRSADNVCRDYVAFESSSSVNPPPAGCTWTGPNPSNGNVEETSLSRFDARPFSDTNSGADWEASGTTTTIGPQTPGGVNEVGCFTDADCDLDGDVCTNDVCNLTTRQCETSPLCNDFNACTDDTCISAPPQCVHDVVNCDDGDACTNDSCDPSAGCQHVPVSCDDSNPCTVEYCDSQLGCVYGAASCDDGSFCTIDSCDANNGCVHTPYDCNDNNACTADSCNEATDSCDHLDSCVSFCGGSIVLNDSNGGFPPAAATPYPSVITVTGLGSPATLRSVRLNGLSHTFPADIDMLLVSPYDPAVNAKIMSDVGLGADVSNINLTLMDSAAASMPDSDPLVSGTFKPTNFDTIDPFLPPAPVATNATALATFGTRNLNGDWKLYIIDDANIDSGTLNQWCLDFELGSCSQDADCNDGNACTTESCDVGTGSCSYTPVSCNDGNACTSDTCDVATGCVYTPIVCDDSNNCTQDSCDSQSGCVYEPVHLRGVIEDNDGDGHTPIGACTGSADDCDDSDPDNWSSCGTCVDSDGDGTYVDCDAYNTRSGPDCDDSDSDNWFSCGTCVDSDGDGYYVDCDAYFNRSGPDCDDSDSDNWNSCGSCVDWDGDGYYIDCDAYNTRSGPDCDDSDSDNWNSCGTCSDFDSDGYYIDCDAYNTRSGPDCDDSDSDNWNSCGTCSDSDGDGYYVDCDAYFNRSGPDCDDNDWDNWNSCGTCADWDGDGYSIDCDAYNTRSGPDCDDNDWDNWVSCGSCADGDGDGYYIDCDAYTTRSGPDCDDNDSDNWISCNTCTDSDSDGWYVDCDAYNNRSGPDCNDSAGSIYPGNSELCDGVDNDCNGDVDDGCGDRVP